MFKWKKLGNLFNPSGKGYAEWMKEFAQAPSVIIFDDFIRVYFSCRPQADDKGQYVSYSGFVDLNRKDLFRIISVSKYPILKLGGLGTFDEFGTYPVSVIRDKNNIKVYYGGWTRCESVPFSDNGESFEKAGNGPILSYSVDEPFILSGPKIRKFNNHLYLFYIAGSRWIIDGGKPEPIYKIRMAISDDGINWTKHNKNLIPNRLEENEAQASPDVFFRNGKYHMFFCYRFSTNYRGKENGYRIGYAFSYDLKNWTRDDSQAGIDVSTDGGWDSEMISYPHVFELDGNVYMLYLGNQVGRYGFGIAQLEED